MKSVRMALYLNGEAWKVVETKWPPIGFIHIENVAFASSETFLGYILPISKRLGFTIVRVWNPSEFYVGYLNDSSIKIKEDGNLGLVDKPHFVEYNINNE